MQFDQSPRANRLQTVVFSADDESSFGAYHDLYASGTTVGRVGDRFGAHLSAHRFPDLLIFDRSVTGASHHRDKARVRRDMFEHINLQVLRSGRMVAGSPGEEKTMSPGDVVVFDTSHPQRTIVENADYVSIAIARSEIERHVPGIGQLHGTVLSPAAAGLLSDFALVLARHASSLTGDLTASSTMLLAQMLALAIKGAEPTAKQMAEPDELDLQRWRAEAFIRANLTRPTLSPEIIASSLGLSRTALFAAFAPVNGVARRILALRLAALRRALLRPGEGRSIVELVRAFGFVEESSCYRAFKAAFGMTPGAMRAVARHQDVHQTTRDACEGWADWWSEIA